MGLFPFFIDITNKKCVIIGAGNVAYRKICTLLSYNANITVISPKVCEPIVNLVNNNKIKLVQRNYEFGDLSNTYIALACACELVNLEVYNEAITKDIYFNCSKPANKSNFNFPAIINKGMLSIGISTQGASPSLSKHIKQKIEEILPEDIDKHIENLAEFRSKILKKIDSEQQRKELLIKSIENIKFLGKDLN